MLIKPSIDSLLKKVDSKYSLVVIAAKRARQIRDLELQAHETDDVKQTGNVHSEKEVTKALCQLDQGVISYRELGTDIREEHEQQLGMV